MEELLADGNLTEEQYNAVIDTNNEVLCLACAGSGKSRTLAFRIARLIREGNLPESIVAFTFTEKAAESLKRRVASALNKCGLPTAMVGAMYIGTIHSYCQNLLGSMDARYRQFEVLDENGFKLFLLSRYYELGIKNLKDERNSRMFATISELARAYSIANDELLDFDTIENEDPTLGACLKLVEKKLNQDQYIDFSSMIRLVVEAIENDSPEVSRSLDQVKHLMVDEYQDVNPSQDALISGMYQHLETLFVVGDDDQSIYGWRGADVRNIIEFDLRYPDCSTLTLSTNFRSTGAIVNSSDRFVQMELSTSRIDKTPVSNSDGNINQFGNFWFQSQQEESDWVAEKIDSMLGLKYVEGDGSTRGLTHADFAILMRSVQGGTRNGGDPRHRIYTQALQNKGINYIIEAEGSIFERPHAFVIREAMEILRTAGVQRSTVIEFFRNQILPVFPNAQREDFLSVISDWNNQIHSPAGGARRKVYPQKLVHDIIEAFQVSTTEFGNKEQVLRDLGVFSSIILDVEKVFVSIDSSYRYQTVLNFLQNVAESGYDTSQVELMSRPDAVTISTVHKMKGLEFPVVFVVDIVNLRFPGRN
ncbi:MAG TPA: ATP-dependent helicase, partial [Pricia sp.]|nr:ATP-dependent helicase [Pricia sp.]